MAVSLTFLFNSDTCYTCQLQNIVAKSSTEQIQLSVSHIAQDVTEARTLIFSSIYTAYKGELTIHDIGSIIESYMQQQAMAVEQFAIKATRINSPDIDEHTLTVVYCKQLKTDIPASSLLTDHFLTNRLQRITCRYAVEMLTLNMPRHSVGGYNMYSYDIKATYKLPDQSVGTYTKTNSGRTGQGVVSINVSPSALETSLRPLLPANAKLIAYTIRIGKRTATFYITDFTNCFTFIYRNAYNCQEFLTIPMQFTEKLSSKSSIAQCRDTSQQYDIQHTRTYKVQTAIQTLADARLLEEFLTSHYVQLLIGSFYHRILITDYTYELSDNPNSANSLKFEFRFANVRQALKVEEYTRIFSPEYTEPFV